MKKTLPPLKGSAQGIQIPIELPEGIKWKPHFLVRGRTKNLDSFSWHVSALASGESPHEPHIHDEEEILLVLSGQPEIYLPAQDKEPREIRCKLSPGDFVYYPSRLSHTIINTDETTINYMMMRWKSYKDNAWGDSSSYLRFSYPHIPKDYTPTESFPKRDIFEFPTRVLKMLHCHCTVLGPRGGYDAHRDDHDVAIIVLEGTVRSLGQEVSPFGIIHIPAGCPHDMYNPTEKTACYLVFEFHGQRNLSERIFGILRQKQENFKKLYLRLKRKVKEISGFCINLS